ncbi:diflavin oxidoreductase [Dyella sp.]|uniref:diflavin oxidoreductase n=1 Tax=Dyella sp. TaxID=1869338 RepID=UPI002ED0DC2E
MNAVTLPTPTQPALGDKKLKLLHDLVQDLSPAQLYAVAAFAASLAEQRPGASRPLSVVTPATRHQATVLYGSQTGNAKRAAERLLGRLVASGLTARLVRADVYGQRELAHERQLYVVISTQGDGDPPDDARGWIDFLSSKRAPALSELHYAVLGLGDSSYPQFCAIGRQVDARLAELGAQRIAPAAEADLDIDTVAGPWSDVVVARAVGATGGAPVTDRYVPVPADVSIQHDRDRPFVAEILANERIVSRDSEREVRHVELSLSGSGLRYTPGDALGIWPVHSAALVNTWLDILGLDRDAVATRGGRQLTLAQWLSTELELTRLSRSFVTALGNVDESLTRALQPGQGAAWSALAHSCRPLDLLLRYRPGWGAQALVDALRPQTPRLYSIASSPLAVGDEEVHLTIAVVDELAHGLRHRGAASGYLADGGEDVRPRVFIEANERFRLPADDTRDIIMIGPGTGVAPFRAFVQERRERSAAGRNWLFFGNRHFQNDFLYQVEWQAERRRGSLHRLDLAFSRDQAQKIYVQHRLREQGADIYAWLSEGAYLYVCGDAVAMAGDVHATLVDIAVTHGGHDAESAANWLNGLMQEGRYARDVY